MTTLGASGSDVILDLEECSFHAVVDLDLRVHGFGHRFDSGDQPGSGTRDITVGIEREHPAVLNRGYP